MTEELETVNSNPESIRFASQAAKMAANGQYDQAISLLENGLERHSSYATAYQVLGNIYIQRGDTEKAMEMYEHALSIDPQNPRVLFELGKLNLDNYPAHAQDLLWRARRYEHGFIALEDAFSQAISEPHEQSDTVIDSSDNTPEVSESPVDDLADIINPEEDQQDTVDIEETQLTENNDVDTALDAIDSEITESEEDTDTVVASRDELDLSVVTEEALNELQAEKRTSEDVTDRPLDDRDALEELVRAPIETEETTPTEHDEIDKEINDILAGFNEESEDLSYLVGSNQPQESTSDTTLQESTSSVPDIETEEMHADIADSVQDDMAAHIPDFETTADVTQESVDTDTDQMLPITDDESVTLVNELISEDDLSSTEQSEELDDAGIEVIDESASTDTDIEAVQDYPAIDTLADSAEDIDKDIIAKSLEQTEPFSETDISELDQTDMQNDELLAMVDADQTELLKTDAAKDIEPDASSSEEMISDNKISDELESFDENNMLQENNEEIDISSNVETETDIPSTNTFDPSENSQSEEVISSETPESSERDETELSESDLSYLYGTSNAESEDEENTVGIIDHDSSETSSYDAVLEEMESSSGAETAEMPIINDTESNIDITDTPQEYAYDVAEESSSQEGKEHTQSEEAFLNVDSIMEDITSSPGSDSISETTSDDVIGEQLVEDSETTSGTSEEDVITAYSKLLNDIDMSTIGSDENDRGILEIGEDELHSLTFDENTSDSIDEPVLSEEERAELSSLENITRDYEEEKQPADIVTEPAATESDTETETVFEYDDILSTPASADNTDMTVISETEYDELLSAFESDNYDLTADTESPNAAETDSERLESIDLAGSISNGSDETGTESDAGADTNEIIEELMRGSMNIRNDFADTNNADDQSLDSLINEYVTTLESISPTDSEEVTINGSSLNDVPATSNISPVEIDADTMQHIELNSITDDMQDETTATMAEIYVRQGLITRAIDIYNRLASKQPDNESIKTRISELEYMRDNDAGEA